MRLTTVSCFVRSRRISFLIGLLVWGFGFQCASGQPAPVADPLGVTNQDLTGATEVVKLGQVEVQADYDVQSRLPFLPDVEGTRINAGKRTSNIDAHYLPEVMISGVKSQPPHLVWPLRKKARP